MMNLRTMLLSLGLLGISTPAAAQSGATNWGPWRFTWEVNDGAGLALRDVHYRDEEVLAKASMPVIRVQYDGDACGPFADMITWSSLREIPECNGQKVCQKSFVRDGQEWLEVFVLAEIGEYKIYQKWYLSGDGQISPRMLSSGLQCRVSHDHHPYWRLDFDVAGAGGDQVFVHDAGGPNEGWGPGWRKYTEELNDLKRDETRRRWFVRDEATGHGVWIFPGADGIADQFAPEDVAVRLFRSSEDTPWPFGASGRLGYDDGESVAEQDIVLWYVAHLRHLVSVQSTGTEWHSVGPDLRVAR